MRLLNALSFAAAAAVSLLAAAPAAAQAWVNPKGQLSLTLRSDYQNAPGVWHGRELVTGIPADAINSAIAAEYAPIDKLSFGLTLNTNMARYKGPATVPGNNTIILSHGSQDDGTFHFSVTDLDLEARYQAYEGAVTLTPVVRSRIPVTDYEQRGYAAAGMGLKELGAGLYLGRYGLGLDDLVFQLGYTFTFVEKLEEGDDGGMSTGQFRANRSDIDLSFAYLFSDKLIGAIGTAVRWTHDGFDLRDYPALFMNGGTDPLIEWHDPVLRARFIAPTAVVNYQVSDAWSVAARFAAIVWGENAANAYTFGLSLGWANNLAE